MTNIDCSASFRLEICGLSSNPSITFGYPSHCKMHVRVCETSFNPTYLTLETYLTIPDVLL